MKGAIERNIKNGTLLDYVRLLSFHTTPRMSSAAFYSVDFDFVLCALTMTRVLRETNSYAVPLKKKCTKMVSITFFLIWLIDNTLDN